MAVSAARTVVAATGRGESAREKTGAAVIGPVQALRTPTADSMPPAVLTRPARVGRRSANSSGLGSGRGAAGARWRPARLVGSRGMREGVSWLAGGPAVTVPNAPPGHKEVTASRGGRAAGRRGACGRGCLRRVAAGPHDVATGPGPPAGPGRRAGRDGVGAPGGRGRGLRPGWGSGRTDDQ